MERAFPVQEVQSIEDMATVDMVAADEKAVRQKIMKSHGLRSALPYRDFCLTKFRKVACFSSSVEVGS